MPSTDAGLAELLDQLASRSHELTTEIVAKIRAEVPGYTDFPYPEHHRDVLIGVESIIDGLRSRQPPTAASIEHTRGMGRRRARFQLALTDSIEAYHISYREIWAELLARAKANDPDLTADLVREVGLLWNWVHRLSAAFAEAHSEESRNEAARRLALRRRFVEALAGPDPAGQGVAETAADLGFAVSDEFVVACVTSAGEVAIDHVNTALAAVPGVGHCASWLPGVAVAVVQDCSPEALLSALRAGEPHGYIGLGLPRRGLEGAATGLVDAHKTLLGAIATGRPVMDFAQDWHRVVLQAERRRLAPLMEPAAAVARANPQLTSTVRAFVESGFSVSACARAVGIHPNSAKYRLERWRALTGWDTRSFNGLLYSTVCLDLFAERVEPSGGSHM